MSTISAGHPHDHSHGHDAHEEPQVAARRQIDVAALTPGPGFGALARTALWFVGVVGILVVAISGFSGDLITRQHALASYHMGFLYALGMALGALGIQMILQQFNAGWSAVVRRTCETIASLFWVIVILFLPIAILELFFTHGLLFSWMIQERSPHPDLIYSEKSVWLNSGFWAARSFFYLIVWTLLGWGLYRLSRKQDVNGDRWLTARARFISSFGLLIFALTTAFGSFDWLMGLDYHWFSTMFGVYFFAGATISCIAFMCVVLCSLRISGRLGNTFTQEHQHDLGKLLFAFTVFWAYVTFCQYFLIWYSNIPEETAFYNLRNDGDYKVVFQCLCLGHFLLPFVLLLIRPLKRNPHTLRAIALWVLLMHGMDLVYIVRPIVSGVAPGTNIWIDIAGILGPLCLFLGFVIWKMGKAPLIPLKDPRLDEVLAHKNYV